MKGVASQNGMCLKLLGPKDTPHSLIEYTTYIKARVVSGSSESVK